MSTRPDTCGNRCPTSLHVARRLGITTVTCLAPVFIQNKLLFRLRVIGCIFLYRRGTGTIVWEDRRWRVLGTQRVAARLVLIGPEEVAQWIGEADRWERARRRYADLVSRWPGLSGKLSRHFDLLADYGDVDYRRLVDLVAWLEENPRSGMYPRQLPVAGLDSKWVEGRTTIVAEMVDAIRGNSPDGGDFYRRCGLQVPPKLIRLRILDCDLRDRVGDWWISRHH